MNVPIAPADLAVFLPPYVRPVNGSVLLQLLMFGMIFKIGGTLINCAVALFASHSAALLSGNVKIAKSFTFLSAALFLVLAARMVFYSR